PADPGDVMNGAADHSVHAESQQDATHLFLKRLFWSASTPLVAGLVLAGCVETEPTLPEEKQLALTGASLHCGTSERWQPMSALHLTEPVDFLALRRGSGAGRGFTHLDAAGVPCGKATAPRLCEAELARVSLLEVHSREPHFILTQGDSVRALATLEQKLTLLGTIDTPDEALLIAQHHGVPVSCGSIPGMGLATHVRLREGGYALLVQSSVACNQWRRDMYEVDVDGSFRAAGMQLVTGAPCAVPPGGPSGGVAGRRPANLCALSAARGTASRVARYFARSAALEAASVPAFEQLAAELRILGAPSDLRQAALRAADDEVRHAHVTSALAEQFGARARKPQLARTRLRSRDEVALDNALEGCVNETYAAYLATAQARLSRGTGLEPALASIASDETEHSALSWRIAAWLEPRLAPGVRRRIAAARERALLAL
ncbi:MAG TPA: ferritin-like domain-containing protein, partial [Polyangiales bacterium]